MVPRMKERVRLQKHTHSAALGVVVHLLLPVLCIVPDLVAGDFKPSGLLGLADNAGGEYAGNGLGKQGQYIDFHTPPSFLLV